MQPAFASQVSSVQGLRSSQFCSPVGTHSWERSHWSPYVQGFPSVQSAPSGIHSSMHPSPVTHEAELAQGETVQTTFPPPMQVPWKQWSSLVHSLLSSAHTVAVPEHALFSHASPSVHLSPSSQVFSFARKVQPVAGTHESVVHSILS